LNQSKLSHHRDSFCFTATRMCEATKNGIIKA